MANDTCGICMGDGRISNSFGNLTTCPSCHGSGRRSDEGGYRDVTKTKPSHHNKPVAAAAKQTWPSTAEGSVLAAEVRDSGLVTADAKTRLIQEIMDHEDSHGRCTSTFVKKIRKQVRPRAT
jgi:RecJ-like exonuclease